MTKRTEHHHPDPMPSTEAHPVSRYEGSAPQSRTDHVIVEEPLGIDVSTERVSMTMRTPGHDAELAIGFLFAEWLIRSAVEVVDVSHAGVAGDPDHGSTITVLLREGLAVRLDTTAARRGTLTTAACGVCGRQSIDDLLARCTPVAGTRRWPASVVATLPVVLRAEQVAIAET
jgi:FdhD protein